MDALLLAPLLTAAAISFSLALFVLARRTAPGAAAFGFLMLAATVWALSDTVSLASQDPATKLLCTRIAYLGIVAVPALWLILTTQFAGVRLWGHPRHAWLLILEPLAVLALIWTNPLHGLFWSLQYTSLTTLDPGHGIAFWIHSIYSYSLLFAGTLLLISVIQRSPRLYRGQAITLLAGALAPWLANFLYLTELTYVENVDLTPFLFAFSGPVLAWGLFQSHLLESSPIGYDAIIENMDDMVVVLDPHLRVVAANRAAESILGSPISKVIGERILSLLSGWPELASLLQAKSEVRQEVTVHLPGQERIFNIRLSPLIESGRQRQGTLLIFHDETGREQDEETLRGALAETRALYNVSRSLTEEKGLPVMLQTIVDEVAAALPANQVWLTTFDSEQKTITHSIKGGAGKDQIEEYTYADLMEGLSGWVIREQKPVLSLNDQAAEHALPHHRQQQAVSGPGRLLIAPLLYQGRLLGIITAANPPDQVNFSQKDVDLLMALASGAAAGVETARLLLSERQQRERAETLGEVAGILNASLDRQQLLTLILEQLARVVEYDSASIMLVSPDMNTLSTVAHRLLRSKSQVIPPGQIDTLPHIHKVLQTRQPEIIDDTLEDPRWKFVPYSDYIRCWLGAPLIVQDRVIGLLNLDRDRPHAFTAQDAHFVQAFASQAAIAIENSHLYESAQRRAEEAETLRQVTAVVTGSLDKQKAIELILKELERVVTYDSASVQLLQDGWLEIVGGRGWWDLASVLGMRFQVPAHNPNTRVIQTARPHIFNNALVEYPEIFSEGAHSHIRSWLGVPLLAHDQVIGMLALDSKQPDHFSENDARLVSAFADQVAIAIENARLYSVERHQVDELNALRATVADISGELELSNLLQAIIQRATTLLNATGGDLGLYDESRKDIEVVVSYNMGQDYTGVRMELGEGAMGQVALSLQPMIIESYTDWKLRSQQYQQGPWRAVLSVPMLIGGRLVGVIGIVDAHPTRSFSASDQRLLNLFAQQAAVAVENARLYQSAWTAAERRAVLHQVSQEIVAVNLDPEGIYSAIHQAATRLMTTEAFVVTLLDEPTHSIDAVYVVDHSGRAPQQRFPADQGLSGHVTSTGQSVYIQDVIGELEDTASLISQSLPLGDDEEVRSLIAVPMRLGSKVTGMLSAQSYRKYDYDEEDLRLLEMLASYAAIALENSRLFKELQKLAIFDPLLEIYNRRHLFELGKREFSRARRFGRALSVIMLDVDHFKLVNDQHGHATGDLVLQSLAHRFRQSVREVDILGRYGGEEFLLILPETDLSAAHAAAERLRVEAMEPVHSPNSPPVNLTISVGVVALSAEYPDLASMVAAADAAQYEAKNSGRNRVVARPSFS